MTAIPMWGAPAELDIFGERLRDARVVQRLKAATAAQSAGISADQYSRYEHNLSSTVKAERARALARAVGFSVEYLASAPVTPVQRGSLLFRAKKSMTRGEEDQLTAWSRLIGDTIHVAEYEVKLPPVRLPHLPETASPAEAAQQTRQALGIAADAPIPHLIRNVERVGVYVAALSFASELHAKHHDAFSTWLGPTLDVPLLVLREESSWERTRLSVAHELGHLVMHRVRRSGDLEAEAYAFAAELLFPAHILRQEWPHSVTLATLMPLKRTWGMSLASLIEHGYRNGLLAPEQRTNLYKQMSNRRNHATGERWRVHEPGWQDREPERPKLIAVVLETAFGQHSDAADIAERVFSWKSEMIHELIAGQVTPWAKNIALSRPASADQEDGHLAEVVQLKPASSRRP